MRIPFGILMKAASKEIKGSINAVIKVLIKVLIKAVSEIVRSAPRAITKRLPAGMIDPSHTAIIHGKLGAELMLKKEALAGFLIISSLSSTQR